MALVNYGIGTGSSGGTRGTSQNNKKVTTTRTTTTPTINNVQKSNPASTGNAYADALRTATTNGTRINGAFNSGTTTTNPVTGSNTTVTGNRYDSWKDWEQANTKTTTNNNNNVSRSSGGSAQAIPVVTTNYSNSSSSSSSEPLPQNDAQKQVDDTLEKIKQYLEEQKKQADKYYKTQYEAELAKNRQQWENDRNQANLNYVRTDRYINSLYGDKLSGAGLSNRTRNNTNWNNNLSDLQRDYTQRDSTSLSDYNRNLANTASTLSQGWYNYVLPVYTNRQSNADNMDYQRWAYEQQLANNRLMNQDDLNYRLQLASMGLLR